MKRLIQNITVFAGLDDVQLDTIYRLARLEKFKKGEVIFRQGDTAADIYIVKKGKVRVSMRDENGECEMTLAIFGPGDCFGEMSIIEIAPHVGTARAEEETELICLSLSALIKLYEDDPRTFAHIILNTAREVSRRLHKADRALIHYYWHARRGNERGRRDAREKRRQIGKLMQPDPQ